MISPARLLSLLAIFLLASAVCLAQSAGGGGTIQGAVKDASGASIPGAKLTILHLDTGRATKTIANAEGFFITPPLPIGRYKVRAEAPGMKAWETELLLQTGKTVDVSPELTPGQVSETIEVSATLPLVTTADPTDASTLDSQRIKELPINGRDLNTLLGDVAPGVEPVIDVNGGARTVA